MEMLTQEQNKILWIGAGNMGLPMAQNLAKAGHCVTLFNRTKHENMDYGLCKWTSNVQNSATEASIVILMVTDGNAVKEFLFGHWHLMAHMKPETIVINMSTIGVDETRELAHQVEQQGMFWLEAPVLGSVQPAKTGALTILVGGREETFQAVKQILEIVGNRIFYLGSAGMGASMKLLINAYLGLTMQSAAECIALGQRIGMSREQTLEVLAASSVWSNVLAAKRSMYLEDEYPAAFALKNLVKDLDLAMHLAQTANISMPALKTTFQTFADAKQSGYGELDMAAMLKYIFASSEQ